ACAVQENAASFRYGAAGEECERRGRRRLYRAFLAPADGGRAGQSGGPDGADRALRSRRLSGAVARALPAGRGAISGIGGDPVVIGEAVALAEDDGRGSARASDVSAEPSAAVAGVRFVAGN